MRSIRGSRSHSGAALCVLILLSMTGGRAAAYEHRISTPSFGVQGGFGKLVSGAPTEDDPKGLRTQFGPSVDVGLRFVLDRNHALGFGFDDLRYKRAGDYSAAQADTLPQWVKFTTVHVDYFIYFQRRMKVCYYLAPFVGMQQLERRYQSNEVSQQDYNLLFGTSVGMEYFIGRTFSVDLSGRAFALRNTRETSIVLQPALGFMIYVI